MRINPNLAMFLVFAAVKLIGWLWNQFNGFAHRRSTRTWKRKRKKKRRRDGRGGDRADGYQASDARHRESQRQAEATRRRERNEGRARTWQKLRQEHGGKQRQHGAKQRSSGRGQFDFAKIVKKFKGRVIQGQRLPVFSFVAKGSDYAASIEQNFKGCTIRVKSAWPDSSFRMRVYSDRNGWGNKRYPGHEDIVIGSPRFDRDFVIHGSGQGEMKSVLNKKVRAAIEQHSKLAHGRIHVEIAGSNVDFGGMANEVLSTRQIIAIIKNFTKIHRLLLEASASASLEDVSLEIKYTERNESLCMVCGMTVGSNDVVSCLKCDTRHHSDCWQYIGQCSTYGCHSRRAR